MIYQNVISVRLNAIPLNKAVINKKKTILIFCFKFLFTWNKTIRPTPAFVRIALRNVPSNNVPSAYSWAEITDVAQFGINPNKEENSGPRRAC